MRVLGGVGILLASCGLAAAGWAAQTTVTPGVRVQGAYDDNVAFTRERELSDFVLTAGPSLRLEQATERLRLGLGAGVDFVEYRDETQFDRTEQLYDGSLSYGLTERFTVRGDASYRQDSTLESQLQETGQVTALADRYRFQGGGGASYRWTERSEVSLDYHYGKTAYGSSADVDYRSHSVAAQYVLYARNQRDTYTVRPTYDRLDSSTSAVDNYGLLLGWSHPFSETLSMALFGGARYTVIEQSGTVLVLVPDPDLDPPVRLVAQEVTETDRRWGAVADLSLTRTGETWSATLGYNRDLTYGSSGEAIERNRLYARTNRALTERLGLGLAGEYYVTRSEGTSSGDSTYFAVSPSLRFHLTREHTLDLGYRYQNFYDERVAGDRTSARNRVWLELRLAWPMGV